MVGVPRRFGLRVPDHDKTAGILLHALTLACPSLAVMSSGPLIIIGGAEDKLRRRTILTEFVGAAGGEEARIAVIATASSLGPEVVEVYDALFRKLGAAEVVSVRPESREEAHDPELVAELDKATGVFMTGGNQMKLSAVVCGSMPTGAASSLPAPPPVPASSRRTWWPSADPARPPSSG